MSDLWASADARPRQDSINGHRPDKAPRTIILCFEGTGKTFGSRNSNVVRFFNALKKDEPDTQIVYYQAGIGTYLKRRFKTKLIPLVASKIDEAIAINLDQHVKDSYAFLINTYKPGNKICLFGFSRGAYIARTLAGMIYKIGLLPPHNEQQIDFALSVYKDNTNLGGAFRRTFATPVKIHFIGVWDTVASVGVVPWTLPYSTQNDGVEIFRHALALDERRARFYPNIWGEPATIREELEDEPHIPQRGDTPSLRDEWVYRPPALTDIKEVWFAGCHSDVGGGSHDSDIDISLSNITLRWMIRECFIANTDIQFDEDQLHDLGLNIRDLSSKSKDVKIDEIPDTDQILPSNLSPAVSTTNAPINILDLLFQLFCWILRCIPIFGKYLSPPAQTPTTTSSVTDILAQKYDQLSGQPIWWILEYVPTLRSRQKGDGSWFRFRWRNYGQGRYLPYAGNGVKVHRSVKSRMETYPGGYTPTVNNWREVHELDMIRWED